MTQTLSVGDQAPNFDLTSTENAVLMLRDEVSRTAVVLYFFDGADSDRVRGDLMALAGWHADLKSKWVAILGVSPGKPDALKQIQKALRLPFPLLSDDRNFSSAYGVVAEGEGSEPEPALVLVGRRQQIAWMANPVAAVEAALPDLEKSLKGLSSLTSNYPRSVINRLVARWVS